MGVKRAVLSCWRRYHLASRCVQRYTCLPLSIAAFLALLAVISLPNCDFSPQQTTERGQDGEFGPIDVVYTWVNGSDPELLRSLHDYKLSMRRKLQKDTAAQEKCKASQLGLTCSDHGGGIFICNNTGCQRTPSAHSGHSMNIVVLQSANLSKLASYDYRLIAPVRPQHVSMLAGDRGNGNVTALLFQDYASVARMVKSDSISYRQSNISTHEGFVASSCASCPSCVQLDDHVVISGPALNSSSTAYDTLHRLRLSSLPGAQIFVWPRKRTAVVRLIGHSTAATWNATLSALKTIPGLTISPAVLLWNCSAREEPSDSAVDMDKELAPSRFQDNEELRFSLRSIERNAPFVRHVFIVTNGQIPYWLNLRSPRVSVVTHKDLFLNISHLPTFSSPSIESHLHRIKGLSRYFIYLNDDVLFGRRVYASDFLTTSAGQKVYLSWPLPACNLGCSASWLSDGACDKTCNVSECAWDGGDCVGNHTRSTTGGYSSFSSSSSRLSKCHSSCSDSWIGDRYCDSSCNVYECGYDAGDCAQSISQPLFKQRIQDIAAAAQVLVVPPGHRAAKVLLAGFFDKVISGDFSENASQRLLHNAVVSRTNAFLTLVFVANTTGLVRVGLAGTRNATNVSLQFNVTFDTCVSPPDLSRQGNDAMHHAVVMPLVPKLTNESNLSALFPLDKSLLFWKGGVPSFPLGKRRKVKSTDHTQQRVAGRSAKHTRSGSPAARARHMRHLLSIPAEEDEEVPGVDRSTAQQFRGLPRRYSAVDQPLSIVPSSPFEAGTGFFPWEKRGLFDNLTKSFVSKAAKTDFEVQAHTQRRLLALDTFGASLTHVNALLNKRFSYTGRKVPAHMPHFIDRHVMERLHASFGKEFDVTSSHKLRAGDDMQFAFSYFYFLMEETKDLTVQDVFSDLDRDQSGELSPGEIRAMLTQMYDLPLSATHISECRDALVVCSRSPAGAHAEGAAQNVSSLSGTSPAAPFVLCGQSPWLGSAAELVKLNTTVKNCSYADHHKSWPVVTAGLLAACPQVAYKLLGKAKAVKRNRFELAPSDDTHFMMIRANISKTLVQLDEVVKLKRKFLCLNDNIDHQSPEASQVKRLLKEFYEARFPTRSQFELLENERNPFLHVDEARKWRTLALFYWIGVCVLAGFFAMLFLLLLQVLRTRSPPLSGAFLLSQKRKRPLLQHMSV